MPFVEEHDLVVGELATEPDRLRRAARDPRDLLPRLPDCRRAVDPDDVAWPLLAGEAGDHPGLGRAGHRADDDRVEEDAQLGLLGRDLVGPAGEPVTAERMVGCARGDRVRLPARLLHGFECLLPAPPEADVEACLREPDVGAHDP